MAEPKQLHPVKIGSGCIVRYRGQEFLFSVAHVTNIPAATCIVTGEKPINGMAKLYSVGEMNYLVKFDISKDEDSSNQIDGTGNRKEDIDTGVIDFVSFPAFRTV